MAQFLNRPWISEEIQGALKQVQEEFQKVEVDNDGFEYCQTLFQPIEKPGRAQIVRIITCPSAEDLLRVEISDQQTSVKAVVPSEVMDRFELIRHSFSGLQGSLISVNQLRIQLHGKEHHSTFAVHVILEDFAFFGSEGLSIVGNPVSSSLVPEIALQLHSLRELVCNPGSKLASNKFIQPAWGGFILRDKDCTVPQEQAIKLASILGVGSETEENKEPIADENSVSQKSVDCELEFLPAESFENLSGVDQTPTELNEYEGSFNIPWNSSLVYPSTQPNNPTHTSIHPLDSQEVKDKSSDELEPTAVAEFEDDGVFLTQGPAEIREGELLDNGVAMEVFEDPIPADHAEESCNMELDEIPVLSNQFENSQFDVQTQFNGKESTLICDTNSQSIVNISYPLENSLVNEEGGLFSSVSPSHVEISHDDDLNGDEKCIVIAAASETVSEDIDESSTTSIPFVPTAVSKNIPTPEILQMDDKQMINSDFNSTHSEISPNPQITEPIENLDDLTEDPKITNVPVEEIETLTEIEYSNFVPAESAPGQLEKEQNLGEEEYSIEHTVTVTIVDGDDTVSNQKNVDAASPEKEPISFSIENQNELTISEFAFEPDEELGFDESFSQLERKEDLNSNEITEDPLHGISNPASPIWRKDLSNSQNTVPDSVTTTPAPQLYLEKENDESPEGIRNQNQLFKDASSPISSKPEHLNLNSLASPPPTESKLTVNQKKKIHFIAPGLYRNLKSQNIPLPLNTNDEQIVCSNNSVLIEKYFDKSIERVTPNNLNQQENEISSSKTSSFARSVISLSQSLKKGPSHSLDDFDDLSDDSHDIYNTAHQFPPRDRYLDTEDYDSQYSVPRKSNKLHRRATYGDRIRSQFISEQRERRSLPGRPKYVELSSLQTTEIPDSQYYEYEEPMPQIVYEPRKRAFNEHETEYPFSKRTRITDQSRTPLLAQRLSGVGKRLHDIFQRRLNSGRMSDRNASMNLESRIRNDIQ